MRPNAQKYMHTVYVINKNTLYMYFQPWPSAKPPILMAAMIFELNTPTIESVYIQYDIRI